MSYEIRLTRDIYYFERGKLSWEESLLLLDEIVDSEEWLQFLEIDMLFYEMTMDGKIKGNEAQSEFQETE